MTISRGVKISSLLLCVLLLAGFMQSIRYNQIFSGDRQGTGVKLQMMAGTPSTGQIARYDSNGNIAGSSVIDSPVTMSADVITSGTIATARLGSGTANNTTFLRGDQSWAAPPGGGDSVPTGAVMSFNLSACPTGWTEFTAARGRYVVGVPSGGTLAASVGTALSNQENRAVGAHNHTFTGETHDHQTPGLQHDHTINVVTGTTSTAVQSGSGTTVLTGITTANQPSGSALSAGGYTVTGTAQGGTIANAGSVSGTNAPYIQLRMCQKD